MQFDKLHTFAVSLQMEPPHSKSLGLCAEFENATLNDIEKMFVPEMPSAAVSRLESLLRQAQHTPPLDRKDFVDRLNKIMDSQRLRLLTQDGHLARLIAHRQNGRVDAIQLKSASRDRGFKNSPIRLVRVNNPSRLAEGWQPIEP